MGGAGRGSCGLLFAPLRGEGRLGRAGGVLIGELGGGAGYHGEGGGQR